VYGQQKGHELFQIAEQGWYVTTYEGQVGPLSSREDAERYLQLLETVDAARLEMAGLDV
jgi:uncharacterized protein YgiM (DUF1202 family)